MKFFHLRSAFDFDPTASLYVIGRDKHTQEDELVRGGGKKMNNDQVLTKSATNVAAISLSNPIFINAFLGMLSLMMSVTSLPKFLNIFANLMAMIPDPVIATLFGRGFKVLMESESYTRLPSKGMPAGRKGVDPVAISILSAFNVKMLLLPVASVVIMMDKESLSPSAKEAEEFFEDLIKVKLVSCDALLLVGLSAPTMAACACRRRPKWLFF